jgi:hypothetical protein
MKNIFLSSLIAFVIFSSCNSHKDIVFKKDKDVIFDLGYVYAGAANFYDATTQKDYIALYQIRTSKSIKIFDENFNLFKEISTKVLTNVSKDIINAEVISLDSVIVRTGYNTCRGTGCDTFYLLNGKGEIVNYSTIKDHPTVDTNSWKYYHTFNELGLFIGNKLYIQTGMPYQFKEYLGRDEESKFSYRETRHAPLITSVELFNPKAKREFYLYDFYKNISTKDVFCNDFYVNIDNYNNRILLTNYWADKIFVINAGNMKLEKTVKVKSDYTTIGSTLVSNDSTHAYKMNALCKTLSNGGIYTIYFDKYRDLYYVAVHHYDATITFGFSTKWSLLIYDKKFEKLKEIPFLTDEYTFGNLLVVKQGILLPKKEGRMENDEAAFTLFSVNYAD